MKNIFCIECLPTGHKYLGSSTNPSLQRSVYFSMLKDNRFSNSALQSLYNQYGRENFGFTILGEYDDKLISEIEAKKEYAKNIPNDLLLSSFTGNRKIRRATKKYRARKTNLALIHEAIENRDPSILPDIPPGLIERNSSPSRRITYYVILFTSDHFYLGTTEDWEGLKDLGPILFSMHKFPNEVCQYLYDHIDNPLLHWEELISMIEMIPMKYSNGTSEIDTWQYEKIQKFQLEGIEMKLREKYIPFTVNERKKKDEYFNTFYLNQIASISTIKNQLEVLKMWREE